MIFFLQIWLTWIWIWIRKTAGSGSAFNECGSTALIQTQISRKDFGLTLDKTEILFWKILASRWNHTHDAISCLPRGSLTHSQGQDAKNTLPLKHYTHWSCKLLRRGRTAHTASQVPRECGESQSLQRQSPHWMVPDSLYHPPPSSHSRRPLPGSSLDYPRLTHAQNKPVLRLRTRKIPRVRAKIRSHNLHFFCRKVTSLHPSLSIQSITTLRSNSYVLINPII